MTMGQQSHHMYLPSFPIGKKGVGKEGERGYESNNVCDIPTAAFSFSKGYPEEIGSSKRMLQSGEAWPTVRRLPAKPREKPNELEADPWTAHTAMFGHMYE
uniref:GATA binding protein 2 n=1 Tax=Haemonchus contortus TaxID=6289 RepID=A0A7I4YXK3_HAECO